MQGLVIKSTGKWYNVELENGSMVSCRIRGKMRLEGLRTTNPIAVGDRVFLDDEVDDEGNRWITGIVDRTNYLVRKSTNLSKQMQILAANVDRAYLVVTVHSPKTHLAFIDRFLVSAESFRIPVTLLFNKIDLCSEEDLEYIDALIFMYSQIGYPGMKISALDISSVEKLKNEIKGKQVIISGHSGVGKSTLINALVPNVDAKTNEISDYHKQGQHTTTFAEMYKLFEGGYIIDTPGIRAFGIVDLDKAVMSHYFPEMRALLNDCRFNNCKHLNEPGCAVKEAVERGDIYDSRYYSYVQLMEEDETSVYRQNEFS